MGVLTVLEVILVVLEVVLVILGVVLVVLEVVLVVVLVVEVEGKFLLAPGCTPPPGYPPKSFKNHNPNQKISFRTLKTDPGRQKAPGGCPLMPIHTMLTLF